MEVELLLKFESTYKTPTTTVATNTTNPTATRTPVKTDPLTAPPPPTVQNKYMSTKYNEYTRAL